jgi:Predicted membrane protein
MNEDGFLCEIKKIALFLGVSTVCGLVDASCGFICILLFNFNLYLSIFIGFSAGLLLGYALHKKFTFKHEYVKGSAAFIKFTISNTFLICVRFCLAWLLQSIAANVSVMSPQARETIIYILVLGFSFCVNYLMCRLWVFRKTPSKSGT